jgi:hypothetical protein
VKSPEAAVQQQLDAYNARDINRFLEVYAQDVQVFRPPAPEPSMVGRDALGQFHSSQRFNLPKLHAELKGRLVLGKTVVDHERVSGIRDVPFEVAVAYEVIDGLIRKVWFFPAE